MEHDIIVKGTGKNSHAECFTCPEDYIDGFPGASKHIAHGSRNHVNRQVKMHQTRY